MIRRLSFVITPMRLVDGTYRAKWIVPIVAPPVENGVLSVVDGRIVEIATSPRAQHRAGASITDLGDFVVLPGLVNAHTHLEFSDLSQPIGGRSMPFPDWIREVIRYRRKRDADPHEAAERRQLATTRGILELSASQTCAVGEIATPGWSESLFTNSCDIDATVFLEILGLDEAREDALLTLAADHVGKGKAAGVAWRTGLSPHSPYTVRPSLVRKLARISRLERIPLAMHLAETPEELELLSSGTGPLVNFLRGLGAWDESAIERGTTPLRYLHDLSESYRALVIHGNYLSPDEIAFLGENHERMSVVYCPRTCQHFGHRQYPLAEMLRAGVCVAVGTDSRASNPELNLFEELRAIQRLHPQVSATEILTMGTRNGATALGLGDGCGMIAVGGAPNVSLVTVSGRIRPVSDSEKLHRFLLECDCILSAIPNSVSSPRSSRWVT